MGDDVGRGSVADLQELVIRVVGPAGGEAVRIGQGGFEVGVWMVRPSERCLRPRRSAALPCRHRRDATISVVGDGRLTLAVDGVAGTTAERIVVARQVEVVLPLVGAMTVDVIGVEVRHDTFGRGV